MTQIRSLAVVGTGLIGTSVGMAASSGGLDVTLYDAAPDTAARAADLGAGRAGGSLDALDRPPAGPVDVVVVATPPATLAAVLRRVQALGLGRTVTDVGSVKVTPRRQAAALGCDLTSYVGGHPMAGRERSGPGAARADLFVGRPWILTPAGAGAEHVDRVRALVGLCGAVPVLMDPPTHDVAVALVSHAPQVVSSLLAARLRDAPQAAVDLSGQGVRDVTRVAASDPGLWTAILRANAGPVRDVLVGLRDDLDRLLDALARLEVGDAAAEPAAESVVAAILAAGVAGRARIPGKHGTPPTTYAAVPVVVSDRPGELARLLTDAGSAGVNVEDVTIEHSPGTPVGLVELAVRPQRAEELAGALRARGWTVHR